MSSTIAPHPSPPLARVLADWAATLRYEDLSAAARHQVRRFLLDTLGCALGGLHSRDVSLALETLDETAGLGPCSVIGTDRSWDPLSAALANALMVRVLDYNDIYWKQDPSHPSDLIPAALALGERRGSGGRDLAVGIALGYEIEMRLCEVAEPGIRERGWHHATLTAIAAPLVAGRMLGLEPPAMAHAVGISACRHATLGAAVAGPLSMMKNTVDPLAAQSGVLAALLAERGYSGPEHVLDGKEGLFQVLGPAWDAERLTRGLGDSWRILDCGMKAFPTEALTHTPISAVLDLVEEYDLAPEAVERVTVRTLSRAADILADPSKYDPRSKETADHSLPYVIAAALVDRRVTPLQFTESRLFDPRLRAQLPKIRVVADPAIERRFPELQRAGVHIHTTDGRELVREIDFPKGDPRHPLSDREVEQKFDALAAPVLGPEPRRRIKEAVWNLESQPSIHDLLALTREPR